MIYANQKWTKTILLVRYIEKFMFEMIARTIYTRASLSQGNIWIVYTS